MITKAEYRLTYSRRLNQAASSTTSSKVSVYPQVCSQVNQNLTAALSKELTQNSFKLLAQLY
jgi:acetylglutamate kinase